MRTLPAACAAATVVLGLIAGCARGPRAAAPAASTAAAASRSAATAAAVSPRPGGMFSQVFTNPALTVAGGSLYLSWDLPPRQQYPPRMALGRVDGATGVIVASNTFSAGLVGLPLYAAGSLWVTDSAAGGELLLRLDPRTLMVTGELKVGSHPAVGGMASHVAFAGGSIWVDGADRLVQVSPQTVDAEQAITFPGADSSDAAASPDGGTLIVSEARSGNGTIQRRDPVTGALLASHPMLGVIAPVIGGVSGDGAWVAEPTGMLGYVERISAQSMTPQVPTQVEGTNGIRANVWNGVLWVSNEVGGAARNYCADPQTGHRLATLPLPDLNQDYLLTAYGHRLYYSAASGAGFAIRTVPIPAACE